MKRVIVGLSQKMDGTYEVAVDPDFVYLDTCVWIEMFQDIGISRKKSLMI